MMPLLYNFDAAKNYLRNSNDESRKHRSQFVRERNSYNSNDFRVREKLPYVFTVLGCLVEEGLISEFQIQKPTLKEIYNTIITRKTSHHSNTTIQTTVDNVLQLSKSEKDFKSLL